MRVVVNVQALREFQFVWMVEDTDACFKTW
jgi:hypothetical protein